MLSGGNNNNNKSCIRFHQEFDLIEFKASVKHVWYHVIFGKHFMFSYLVLYRITGVMSY